MNDTRTTPPQQGKRWTVTVATAIAILGATIAGCNDPRAANENNFREAIQAYYDSKRPCFVVFGVYPNDVRLTGWDAAFLVEMGFATDPVTVPRDGRRFAFDQWDLTPEGRAALDSVEEPISGMPNRRGYRVGDQWGRSTFCFAEGYRVTEVVNYTEPAASFVNAITSIVNYRYEIVTPTEWAENAKRAIEARWAVPMRAFNGARAVHTELESMTEPQMSETALVQTANGWRDSRAETME